MHFAFLGVTDGPDSLSLQIKVVKLVTSVPKSIPKEVYITSICEQLVDLLLFGASILDKVSIYLYIYRYISFGTVRIRTTLIFAV